MLLASFLPVASGTRGIVRDNGAVVAIAGVGMLAVASRMNRKRALRQQQLEELGEGAVDLGSLNVVTDNGFHRTAIHRDRASVPLRHLKSKHPEMLQGRLLDFGSGKGRDCKVIRATCYDPHHPKGSVRRKPTGKYEAVMMTYVANVLPPAQRAKAIKEASSYVRTGGTIVIATRSTSDPGLQAAKKWRRHHDGYAQFQGAKLKRFQKFYTQSSLNKEVANVLGARFVPVRISRPGGHTEMVAYRRIR